VEDLINDTEEIHPVSQFHKDWIIARVTAVAGDQTTRDQREEAIASLTNEQRSALGFSLVVEEAIESNVRDCSSQVSEQLDPDVQPVEAARS